MSKLQPRGSCRNAFRELGLLTLPCLYIKEVTLCCKYKCSLVHGSQFQRYETRGRDDYQTRHHRTMVFEHLPSQAGVKFLNKLPEGIKQEENKNKFKTRLKRLLVSKVLYSVDEFMMSRWDD